MRYIGQHTHPDLSPPRLTSTPGVHIEEEEQGEEVDNSIRGRLLRLLEKVKKFREKKVEVEPEVEEEKKPGEHWLV